jgi:predicted RNase H-like nuclease
MRGLGVDVAGRFGWVGVIIDDAGFRGSRVGSLAELIQWAEPVAAIGVDIPIGTLPGGGRLADAAARRFVGPRRSSVFNSPPTEAVTNDTYEAANRELHAHGYPRMSRQTWGLRAKMMEAEAIAQHDDRLVEVHPEVSFCALSGTHLGWSKKSWNGQMFRIRLLDDAGIRFPDDMGGAGAAPVDDVLDATAAAWSAHRRAHGLSVPLPDVEEFDARGHRLAIWY